MKSLQNISYVNLNKALLTFLGLWPSQSTFTKRFNFALFALWTVSTLIALFEGLIEITGTSNMAYLQTFCIELWISGSLLLGIVLYSRSRCLKILLEQIESNEKAITDRNELAIMETHTRLARSLTFVCIASSVVSGTSYFLLTYLPVIFDQDNDRSWTHFIYSKRWIVHNNAQRFQEILHIWSEVCYCAILYIAVMGLYLWSIQHACGMYSIVSYRLKKLRGTSPTKRHDSKMMLDLVNVVAKHQAAIKYTDVVRETFGRLFYALHLGSLACLSLMLLALLLSYRTSSTISILRTLASGAMFFQYMFYLNYGGEKIIESSNQVFLATYYVQLDTLSTDARKFLLMVIMRSSRTNNLTGGTITLSFENYTKIINRSWSFATVLLTTQVNNIA